MAKKTQKKVSTPADKAITAVFVAVIVIILGLAVFATYSKIAGNIEAEKIETENAAIEEGSMEANVRYLAASAGLSEEEYLEQYGLTLGGDITKDTTQSEMIEFMTIENYYKYTDELSGYTEDEATDVEEQLTEWSASDYGITKDTVWSDMEDLLPVVNYLGGEDEFNDLISSYAESGYDLSALTQDMSVSEAQTLIEEVVSAGPTSTTAPEDDASEADTEDTTADAE